MQALELLKEGREAGLSRQEQKSNPVAADGTIQFSNIYETSSVARKGDSSPLRPQGAPAGEGRPELGSLVENPSLVKGDKRQVKTSSFAISGDLSKIDPKKPTVAFLDDKSKSELKIDGQNFSHADLSALAAQKGGFNAIVLDISKNSFAKAGDAFANDLKAGRHSTAVESARKVLLQSGGDPIGLDKFKGKTSREDLYKAATSIGEAQTDISVHMNEFAEKVKSGQIPMGKGDVLNVSLGDNAAFDKDGKEVPGSGNPTFEELSKKLGFEVNKDNLSANKDRILERLGEIAKDPSDPAWQKRAERAIKTNKAIENVQSTGIEVLHSASNDGNDRVDINFLKANHELQSVDPETGKPDKFSGAGNKDSDGVVPIYRTGSTTGGDPTYRIAGKEFKGTELEQLNADLGLDKRNKITAPGTVSSMEETVKGKDALDKLFSERGVGRAAPELKSKQGDLVAVAVGTSFANIKFLQQEQSRLKAKKQDHASSTRI